MSIELVYELWLATLATIYMVLASGLLAFLFGLPLGFLLFATRQANILKNNCINKVLAMITNIIRSIPFIILLVAVIPLTRFIVGTSIGTTAAIVPLSLSAIPFVGRLIEGVLNESAGGLIEAGVAMGATPWQILTRILLPEAIPGMINVITITLISLLAYSAMAGVVGGGGLGDLAIRYGYQRFDVVVMLATIVILVLLTQAIQWLGDYGLKRFTHR